MHLRYCGKLAHATAEQARAHLHQLRVGKRRPGRARLKKIDQKGPIDPKSLQVYYCFACKAYHVGHDRRFNLGRTDDRDRARRRA